MLYTYNQAAFVEEAVRSALGQRDCRLDRGPSGGAHAWFPSYRDPRDECGAATG